MTSPRVYPPEINNIPHQAAREAACAFFDEMMKQLQVLRHVQALQGIVSDDPPTILVRTDRYEVATSDEPVTEDGTRYFVDMSVGIDGFPALDLSNTLMMGGCGLGFSAFFDANDSGKLCNFYARSFGRYAGDEWPIYSCTRLPLKPTSRSEYMGAVWRIRNAIDSEKLGADLDQALAQAEVHSPQPSK